MAENTEKEPKPKAAAKPQYTKDQFLSSERYTSTQKDVLAVVLVDGETYTEEQAQKRAEDFLRKEVR